MRDNLNGTPMVITAAFFLQYGPVDLTGGHIGILIQIFINKTFIVTEIQIGFCSVIRYENFTVLDRIHGTGINIDIRVEFLHGYFITTRF